MAKGSMQQEKLTILNIYAPNRGAPRYIRQVFNDLQRDLDSHTKIVGDFNTPLSILDRSTRQKINKDIQDLNSDLEQANLIDISRLSTPNPQNIHSSQHDIIPTLKLTTYLEVNHSSANAKEQK